MFSLKKLPAIPQDRQPFVYLALAGILEFLFITMVSIPSYVGYYLAETYLIVPCLLFLGYVLREKQTGFARRRLLLAVVAVIWFVISQTLHKLNGMENQVITNVFAVYLLAFPFAALTDDREDTGIRWFSKFLVAATLVLVMYTVILMLDMVPADWREFLYWDGTRLTVFWHPNITACYLMMGIGFCIALLIQTRKPLMKVLLAAAVATQFLVMALTNCRTTLLMTGALLGGVVFFCIFRGSWKQFVLGLLAAALVLVGSFKFSGVIYQWNEDRIYANISALQELSEDQNGVITEEDTEPEIDQYDVVEDGQVAITTQELSEDQNIATTEGDTEPEIDQYDVVEDDQVVITTDNYQESFAHDMRTLNGRTNIWQSALLAIQENNSLAWYGTEYIGTVISVYNFFPVEHSHNSWMEVLMRTGVPGLLITLVFTGICVVSAVKLLLKRETELWKKAIAMTTMCVMVAGFLEPYLFGGKAYYHAIDFAFFLCTGYLDYWCHQKKT